MQEIVQEDRDGRQDIRKKLRRYFDGRIVRKDLTMKDSIAVPTMRRSSGRGWRM